MNAQMDFFSGDNIGGIRASFVENADHGNWITIVLARKGLLTGHAVNFFDTKNLLEIARKLRDDFAAIVEELEPITAEHTVEVDLDGLSLEVSYVPGEPPDPDTGHPGMDMEVTGAKVLCPEAMEEDVLEALEDDR